MNLSKALAAAQIAMTFGKVERATLHPDGSPESDATHTVMLILIVAELAREEGLDVATAVQFAAVHDLPETYAGDTNTAGGLTSAQREAKAAREAEAIETIRESLGDESWTVQWVDRYERQDEPESRLVRYVDKILPKLTHALNGGIALEAIGMSPQQAHDSHVFQGNALAASNPSMAATRRLFEEAHLAAVRSYQERLGRRST